MKAVVFPVVMYKCERWTIKAEHWRIDAFKLCCWRRLSRVPWTARRSNQSILKEINPKYSLEGLMLQLKLQYFGHRMQRTDSLKKTDAGKDWRQEKKGTTEKEMTGWHHWLNGHEFEHVLGDGETPVLWPPHVKSWLIGKDSDAGRDWGQEEKGTTQDEMVGWYHRLNGYEFEQAPGDGERQGSLVCCSPWSHRELNKT